jgi:nuclear pore complex protein Nup153
MRNTVNSMSEIKNISGRRSIRHEELSSHKNVNNNEDRSISEPPQSYSTYENHNKMSFKSTAAVTTTTSGSRLKPIREDGRYDEDEQGSSDDDDDLSKSNSQLNESDLDIPDSVSQTPTPTPLGTGNARRINSETNLNDSKRRMTGFMGNRSKRFCASTSELSFTSHLDTRKSLFSPKNNQRSLSRSSLYGSNTSLNSTNSRLFMINSPFYNGKTMFGGASAYPKRDLLQQHTSHNNKVLRTPIQMRPSSSLSNSSVTSTKSDSVLPESNAAKRILDIMTQFNGPLKDVRNMGSNINSIIKLPGLVQNRKRYGEEELNLDRSIRASTAPYGRPIIGKEKSESSLQGIAAAVSNATSKPQIPTMSQLLQLKRLQHNTERVREIANRSHSFLNQVQDYKLPNDNYEMAPNNTNNSASSLKIKNNFTKNLLRNDKNAVDQLPPAPLNLPNIQLPELKSIPKFDIQLPSSPPASLAASTQKQPTNSSKSISPSIASAGAPIMSFSNTPSLNSKSIDTFKKTNCSDFQFSNPIKLSSDFDTKNLMSVTDRFVFSKPSAIEGKFKIVL